jgi:hypothetical protein
MVVVAALCVLSSAHGDWQHHPPNQMKGDVESETAARATGIDPALAAAYFAQAEALSEQDDGALWGKVLDGPTMFVDRISGQIITNAPDKQRRLIKHPELDVYIGALPSDLTTGNTATDWAGVRWAMMVWPVSANAQARGVLMMHESFHRIQPSLGLKLAAPRNHHLDTLEARLWMRLEWRALRTAMESDAPLEHESLRDALLFRAMRWSLFEEAQREECELELNEGLAEYTGFRLGGLTPDEQWQRAIDSLEGYEHSRTFVRTFAYANGPAYGLLLDRARPTWRTSIRSAKDYGTVLQRAVKIRLPRRQHLDEQAMQRAPQYGYEVVLAEETQFAEARAQRQAELQTVYVDGPLLIIPLTGEFRYTFSPHAIEALEPYGTWYGSMRLVGEFGQLDATNGALLREVGRNRYAVCVPASDEPDESPMSGDGWTLQLKNGWTLQRAPSWAMPYSM